MLEENKVDKELIIDVLVKLETAFNLLDGNKNTKKLAEEVQQLRERLAGMLILLNGDKNVQD